MIKLNQEKERRYFTEMISLSIQLVVPVDIPVEEEDRFGDGRKRGTTCANVYLPKEQPTKTVGRGTLIHLTGFSNGERIEWV